MCSTYHKLLRILKLCWTWAHASLIPGRDVIWCFLRNWVWFQIIALGEITSRILIWRPTNWIVINIIFLQLRVLIKCHGLKLADICLSLVNWWLHLSHYEKSISLLLESADISGLSLSYPESQTFCGFFGTWKIFSLINYWIWNIESTPSIILLS